MQHVWWIPWLVIFHSSFLSEHKNRFNRFLGIWWSFSWCHEMSLDATDSGRKEEFANSKYKNPACQSIYASSVIIEPPVFVIIQEHARQVSSDQCFGRLLFSLHLLCKILKRGSPSEHSNDTCGGHSTTTITIKLDLWIEGEILGRTFIFVGVHNILSSQFFIF